jgi:ATP/ADP translocase
MRKVYVVNKSTHDLEEAKRFGELVYLSIGTVSKFATTNMVRLFTRKLQDSEAHDYILLSGLTVMSVIACLVFYRVHKRVNLLIYRPDNDGRANYVTREVVLGDDDE